jgi:hypothetical protein
MTEEEYIRDSKGYKPFKSFGAVSATLILLIIILIVVNILFLNNLNKPFNEKAVNTTVPSIQNVTPPITPPPTQLTEVNLTLLSDNSCNECTWTSLVADSLESASNQFKLHFNRKVVDYSTLEGKDLVKKYNITKIPTFLLSKEANTSEELAKAWPNTGTIENDGTLVLRNVYPPYRNLTTSEIVGRVKLIELNDSTCATCYDVSMHEQTFEMRFFVKITNITTYDISSDTGRELVKKYNITKIPTVIISPELKAYMDASPQVAQLFELFLINESDGWYVFRTLEIIAENVTYKDLTKNTTIISTG